MRQRTTRLVFSFLLLSAAAGTSASFIPTSGGRRRSGSYSLAGGVIRSKQTRLTRRQNIFMVVANDQNTSNDGIATEQNNNVNRKVSNQKKTKQKPPPRRECKCSYCNRPFASRNALFQHLKTDENCAAQAGYDIVRDDQQLQRNMIAISFGYDSSDSTMSSSQFGDLVRDAFDYGLATKYAANTSTATNGDEEREEQVKILTSSQSSVPKLRHISLAQEDGCSALGDVLVLSYNVPSFAQTHSSQEMDILRRKHVQDILQYTNSHLQKHKPTHNIEILSACLLEPDSRLHAERGCTQRVYHYMLPLRWLPGGDEVAEWWLDNQRELALARAQGNDNISEQEQQLQQVDKNSKPRRGRRTFGGVGGGEFRAKKPPPKPSMRLLKDSLRFAESKDLSAEDIEQLKANNDRRRVASGRFGALFFKERRSWHNYAAPKLRGLASPSNEPVWKSIDRARIVEFFGHRSTDSSLDDNEQEVILVLEFRGEDFIEESVRRMVGASFAMSHGWLPSDFYELSTRPDAIIETPLAPPGRLCFAGARFHFDELANGGKTLFEDFFIGGSSDDGDLSVEWANKMRHSMLDRIYPSKNEEDEWLEDLRNNICPRIRHELDEIKGIAAKEEDAPIRQSVAPVEYNQTLTLLRDIISSGRWPKTSVARSKVIRGASDIQNVTTISGGSFTVVNPSFNNGVMVDPSNNPPLANQMFPDLADAVYELERILAPSRPASSHCAVNCKAQFLPHVDSGRGAGQSLSMIVGLGDYSGGDIVVEGCGSDIRYNPLEFDGWKERHWTGPYTGERFSLVWFTPQMDRT